ncbi:bifunctional metallophosphatase/5'-nucleotidase [Microvirga mediterraneensis]|uniref:Bifunctional metallophosphatase/5'-nucleotidase n=1 Tax=Microvirga mediterraneensis TaxID=2754695 RepID=A0A838BKW8_9HYPH|nr:bifunctional UDP-sugar hydrolase/5'-nucleotidase [Microvirga mediterraneensis]MBA1155775.1 bifunctional metallophosphatase/5'-nucleotidase [Microvirga mediterraneensis]
MLKLSRRHALGLSLGAILSATLLTGPSRAQTTPPKPTFSLLLVNDIYKMSAEKGRGGFGKLATIVKEERARGVPMLFAHGGDTFSPSLMSGFDQGEHIVELTNMVKPDVFVPGNHEFDFGKDIYLKRMGEAKFPFFGANIRQADGTPVPGMKDNAIFDLGPVKVGVVGLALAETARLSSPGDLKFLPELETLKTQAADLRKQGADMIVAVTHTDRSVDNAIVQSGVVDVLLTGHDHDLIVTYNDKTAMVESGEDAHYVTSLDITATVSGEGKDRKVSWTPNFRIHNTADYAPDADVEAVVKKYEALLSKELDVELGTSTNALDSRSSTVRSQEAAIGNLIADAIKASTGGDVAIVNGGGIRANKEYPAGVKLTRRDILSELPFGNSTSLVAITGADIKAALENGVSQMENRAGRFPQVSGLKFEVDSKAPAGSRVSNILVNGQPIDMAGTYKVATNNFMLTGGDGYASFGKGKVLIGVTDGKLMANEVMAYVRKLGTVDAKVESRIVIR